MTRRIVLELAEDTTEKYCGSCPHEERSRLVPFAYKCSVTKYLLPVINDRSGRTAACLAAEHEAARMVDPTEALRHLRDVSAHLDEDAMDDQESNWRALHVAAAIDALEGGTDVPATREVR